MSCHCKYNIYRIYLSEIKKAMNPKFESGDKIYHPYWGWGTVVKHQDHTYMIDHGEQTHHSGDDYVEKMYSFKEYDLVNGGWSQDIALRKSAGDKYKEQEKRDLEHQIYLLTRKLNSI